MKEYPYEENRDQIRELLKRYENLKEGSVYTFFEEDDFERIINYFEEKEQLKQAFEAVNAAIEQYPFSGSLLVKKAGILLAKRKYQAALEILDHASLLDNGDINLYILKTDAYLALDMQEKAVGLLEEALTSFEGDEKLELLFELADVYDDYEEFDKVFECLKMILELDPNNEEALYKICFWTDFTGRNEESIRLHKKIIDDFPYNELAWFNLAAAYQGLKLYEKAIDAYQYAITIEEKFDYAYRNMGDAYIRLRKYKEAIEALQKVTELSKPELVIYEAIGHCYDKLKKFGQARFYYRKASHLNQEDSKLFYKIGLTYFNEENWTNCVKQLEQAVKIHRMQPEYNLLMGECKMKQGLLKEALQFFSNVVRTRPRNIAGWEALIRCLYENDLFDEAIVQAELALKATKGKTLFLFYKSMILLINGKNKEALLQLERALMTAPKLVRKFIDLNPSVLQNQQVVDILAKYKTGMSTRQKR